MTREERWLITDRRGSLIGPRFKAPVDVSGRDATIEKIVYCTARVGAGNSPQSAADQDTYLKALTASRTVDHIEYGHYTARTRKGLLATEDSKHRPQIHTADWPVKIQDAEGNPIADARYMAQFLFFEEKGSDVNVATHLTLDLLQAPSTLPS